MRKIYSLAALACSFCFAQTNTKEFYVVAKENIAIEPSAKSVNPDGHLSLTFSKPAFQTFFNDKSVYKYEKAFPTAVTPYLQRTYILTIDNTVTEANLKSSIDPNGSEIEYIKELEKGGILYEPNDYYNNNFYNTYPMAQLDLVRAPLAWEITKGNNPNIIIGISDDPGNHTHEDLYSNIIQNIGDIDYGDEAHGTKVASAASGVTDNGKGISSIGYNTKMILYSKVPEFTSYNSDYYRINQLLELSKISNVKIVNASWYRGCSPNLVDEKVIKEIWDSGVIPVFAAGNGHECGGADHYLYPQAYGYGINVTAVGHSYEYDMPFTNIGSHEKMFTNII